MFSTRAESRLYRDWGCDVIGMTALPEARLAREAELPYALVGIVTDYDSWRDEGPAVDLAAVVAQAAANGRVARAAVTALASLLPSERSAVPADTALDGAIFTAAAARDPALIERNAAILARVLG
jgi:5'-methylthioadenosine phosphorylase